MDIIKTIIVDDEARIRRGIERLVRSCGEEWEIVGMFADGKEAYEAMMQENQSFDLLITDVRMPEMDGLTLVKELKKTHSFSSLIVSGFDDFQYLQTALREGAMNYILKPIDREKFREQIEEVKERIIKQRSEQKEVQEKELQLTYTKQVQLLSEVTWNHDTDVSLLNWTREFPKGTYRLIYVSTDQKLSKTKSEECEAWRDAIEKLITELFGREWQDDHRRYWWWRGTKLSFWLLLLDEEQVVSSTETKQTLQQLKQSTQRLTPFTVSVAFGNEFEDVSFLPSIRDQLLSLLQFRMIQGGNQIFQLDSMQDVTDEAPRGISAAIYKSTHQILHALEQKPDEETEKALQLFFHEIQSLSLPAALQEAVHYLCIRIINRWMEHQGFKEDPHVFTEALQLTQHAGDFAQLKDGVKHWVLRMKNKMLIHHDSNPMQQAKEFIQDHLGENITIKRIADHVYMNPTYFCESFKKQTGETVLDYVIRNRLEKAKKLLKMTDLKVYDISAEVGYQDTKYFSRLFKEWIGQSPSQYREHYVNRE
ncbi:response regulator [Ectobacillus funiculus]|uniref:response regulator n=1 Tax=Ectobacillus funiculus TaxID=137993 RepID=UPI00397DC3C4